MSFTNKKEERFSNISPDQQKKVQQIYEYLYEKEDQSEKGEILRALGISIVMFGLAIAIAFHYIGAPANVYDTNYAASTTENSTSDNKEAESDSTQDTTTEEIQQENTLEYVAQDNTADFSKCLSPDDYEKLTLV